jgi:hypothetical protein
MKQLLIGQQKAGSQNPKHLKQIARDTSSAERTRNASAATMHSTCHRDAANFTICRGKIQGWGVVLIDLGREGWDGAPLSKFNAPKISIYSGPHQCYLSQSIPSMPRCSIIPFLPDVAVFWGEGGAFCAGADLKRASARSLRLPSSPHLGPQRSQSL